MSFLNGIPFDQAFNLAECTMILSDCENLRRKGSSRLGSSWTGELVTDLSRKDNTLACLSAGHRKPFFRPKDEPIRFQVAPTYREKVECVAYSKCILMNSFSLMLLCGGTMCSALRCLHPREPRFYVSSRGDTNGNMFRILLL